MNILKRAVKAYFNWWTNHITAMSSYNAMTPTGMIPWNYTRK